MEFWEDDAFNVEFPTYDLELTQLQSCEIKSINRFANKSVIFLECKRTKKQAICNVEGFWLNINMDVGDSVNVAAEKLDDQWIINNEHGFLIYEPNMLISTTSVVGSIWCKRRHILTELFRGFEPTNEVMAVGSFVHTILQTCLRHNIYDREDVLQLLNKELDKYDSIRRLYECGLTTDQAKEKLEQFVPNIQYFFEHYVKSRKFEKGGNSNENWQGVIISIDDIEENIWCTDLGLKGKVDVSVKTDFQTLPLEIKTGRATFSLEHKGQVILYIMMMQKLGYPVSSGLLLYIRENVLREVHAKKTEMRDLIILRNDLSYYLTRKSKIGDENSLTVKMYPPELPPPINHPSCQKCPYKYMCSAYSKHFQENISSNKILKEIQEEMSSAISETHLNYVMKWITLLDLEFSTNNANKNLRDIYTLSPKEREDKGKCITNLKVSSIGAETNGIYEHHFEKEDNSASNLYANGIMEGHYVLISTDKRTAIAAGFVNLLTPKTVSVFLERNLTRKYPEQVFHIDGYESSIIKSFNLTSLSLLLDMSPKAEKIRQIIIDKVQPTFRPTLPKLIGKIGKPILKTLNVCQQRAVLRALTAKDYFLIKGMPGTGKTATLAALVKLLYEIGKSILITSHTHNAVDHLCLKLLDFKIKFMRLGSESRIHPDLKEYSESSLTKHCCSTEELEAVYSGIRVFAVTCLGSGHPLLSKRSLDMCIIDESTQVLQCSLIRPICTSKTFILIGDPEQLPAVVKNHQARDLGMSETLFERLYKEEYSTVMNVNYRMNSRITELANEFTYNGQLLIGSEDVANATIKLSNKQILKGLSSNFPWVVKALDESMENSVQFIDTGPVWKLHHNVSWRIKPKVISNDTVDNEGENNLNIYEAAVIFKLTETLIKCDVNPEEIGVISTFRVQAAQISAILNSKIDVSTVDQFQGKDKNVIIYSCSKSVDTSKGFTIGKHSILEDKRRLTVALTRSKRKLIFVGDTSTLNYYTLFRKIIPFLKNNVIRLNECKNFSWHFVDSVL